MANDNIIVSFGDGADIGVNVDVDVGAAVNVDVGIYFSVRVNASVTVGVGLRVTVGVDLRVRVVQRKTDSETRSVKEAYCNTFNSIQHTNVVNQKKLSCC